MPQQTVRKPLPLRPAPARTRGAFCLLGLVGAVALARPALAQQAGPAQPAARDLPRTHTVRPGDTLWGLAQQYLKDPFLWPAIYRLNTAVVEDPHWIYPGEVLRLSGGDDVASVPATDTPPPAPEAELAQTPAAPAAEPSGEEPEMQAPLGFNRTRASDRVEAAGTAAYRPLRRGEFFSSGFLTEERALPFGTLLNGVVPSQIPTSGDRGTLAPYARVAVQPPAGATYQVGDSLLVVELGREVEGYGEVVLPTGLARITEISNGHPIATLVALYGAVRPGQRLLPAEHFADAGEVRAQPVADGVRATVLGAPVTRDLKTTQGILFLGKGRRDGVAPGDLFEVRRTPGTDAGGAVRIDDLMAVVQVVRVGERSATTRILMLASPDIPVGTAARQVAKLPS